MRNIFIGFVLGLVVASVGFSGIARIADKGVKPSKLKAKNWPSKSGNQNQNYAKSG